MLFNELRLEDPTSFTNYIRLEEGIMNELIDLVTPFIKKHNTILREAISPKIRLATTLRYLATGSTFQDLSYSTRIAPNTLSQLIPETLKAIIMVLEQKVIPFPVKADDWTVIAEKFNILWQFPHCVGALDGKHIAFRPPRSEGSKYRNYKGSDSIILMALVDAEYKFLYVDVGKNGRTHDSLVFRNSCLGEKLKNKSLHLPEPNAVSGCTYNLPYVIIADDAFSLHVNLMKPYPERNLTHEKKIFNYRLSRARRVVENAFGILTNRFRILLNPIPLSVEKVEMITYVCILLHNFILGNKILKKSYIPFEYRKENTDAPRCSLRNVCQQSGNHSSREAQNVRNLFLEYFNDIGAVFWQEDAVNGGNY
ncbi:uncharacterized protein [Prorops nasuta]|uniref:uncharacterized protein n=1 Tax=Prorops nasuta TaxID=863751 RepID=UPI0034D00943